MEMCGAEMCSGLVLQGKWTPLHKAAQYGNTELVQLLLTAKSNLHAETIVSASPTANMMLRIACSVKSLVKECRMKKNLVTM